MNDNTPPALLDYEQAAAYLSVPIGTLRAMVHRKEIVHYRLSGSLIRFDVADLGAWLLNRTWRHNGTPSKEHEDAVARLAPTSLRSGFAAAMLDVFGLSIADGRVIPDAYDIDQTTKTVVLYELEHMNPIDSVKLSRVVWLREALVSRGWSVQLMGAGVNSRDWSELDIDTGSLSAAECERIARSGIGPRFEMPRP